MAAAHLLPSLAQAQQSDDTSSGTSPLVTKAPATKTQTEAAPSFDAKFSAASMSNNIFRGYTLSNNLPSVTGTVEATYSIFFASVNGASVQIPELSHFQMTNTIGLRPEFGKLTVEGGVGYYTYPGSQVDESYAELYVAPTYAVTPKLTLGLSVYYGPNYYRTGAWENYDAVNGKYDFGHGLTLSAELGRQSFGTTADTPPIKLPDYIYGHVGATYTYNALSFGSALPRHDAVATKLLCDHRHRIAGRIERLPADHRRYSVLERRFVRAEIRLRRGTVIGRGACAPSTRPVAVFALRLPERILRHRIAHRLHRFGDLGHIAERAIAQLLSVRHDDVGKSTIAFGGCLHASDQ